VSGSGNNDNTRTIDRFFTDDEWRELVKKIEEGKCTPFLGSEASFGPDFPASTFARNLALKHQYPFNDSHDLARVAQYIAMKKGRALPKEEVKKLFDELPPPKHEPGELHYTLAELPLSLYVTTTYNGFMSQALAKRTRYVTTEVCVWNAFQPNDPVGVGRKNKDAGRDRLNPLVYHLYGSLDEPNSLVLTEDDFLEFLIETTRNEGGENDRIPTVVRKAFSQYVLLFLGYRFDQTEFRILLHCIGKKLEMSRRQHKLNLTVQMIAVCERISQGNLEKVVEFLSTYYREDVNVRLCNCSSRDFVAKLWEKWEEFHGSP
jgi:hypothetical protein